MQIGFFCPDGMTINTESCIKECRLGERCLPVQYLKMIGKARDWNGIPSVTQLIRGTCESYLMIINDYFIHPEEKAWIAFGLGGHKKLEEFGVNAEEGLELDGITGIPDDIEECVGGYRLIDTKFVGSYKLAKMLGVTKEKTDLVDEMGQPIMYRGKQRTSNVFRIVPEAADNFDYELQGNCYARMLGEKGIDIVEMYNFAIPRDGGTVSAKSNGIDKLTYMVPLAFFNGDSYWDYMKMKRDKLIEHLTIRKIPDACTGEECWDGRKCAGYCDVSFCCPHKDEYKSKAGLAYKIKNGEPIWQI